MIRLLDVYTPDGLRNNSAQLFEVCKEREQENIANISFKMPTVAQHVHFMESKPYRFWYLLEWIIPRGTNSLVGYISATTNNEIGIVLLKAYRGMGIGPMAIRQFIANHHPNPATHSLRSGEWLANIAPNNEHSKHLFTKLGFRHIQSTFALEESNVGEAKDAA